MPQTPRTPEVTILLDTSEQWGRQIVRGILSYTDEAELWYVRVHRSGDSFESLPGDLRADGIIAEVSSPNLAEALKDSGIPFVNVSDAPPDGYEFPSVRSDDRITVKMALEHFQECGLNNFATVASDQLAVQTNFTRLFQKAAAENEAKCCSFVPPSDRTILIPALKQWLLELPKPCGVLVWGHSLGATVVECCHRAGIPVPHDVAVLSGGYDEVLSRAISPAVSGVLQPSTQIGRHAAGQLGQLMRGEAVPNEITWLPPLGIACHPSTDTLAVVDSEIAQVIRFLRKNAHQPISMKDILTEFSFAKSTLERQFRKSVGCSPFDLLRRVRINKARELLINSDLTLQKIAHASGFGTYSYFTRVFKKETGQSPRAFRSANRGSRF